MKTEEDITFTIKRKSQNTEEKLVFRCPNTERTTIVSNRCSFCKKLLRNINDFKHNEIYFDPDDDKCKFPDSCCYHSKKEWTSEDDISILNSSVECKLSFLKNHLKAIMSELSLEDKKNILNCTILGGYLRCGYFVTNRNTIILFKPIEIKEISTIRNKNEKRFIEHEYIKPKSPPPPSPPSSETEEKKTKIEVPMQIEITKENDKKLNEYLKKNMGIDVRPQVRKEDIEYWRNIDPKKEFDQNKFEGFPYKNEEEFRNKKITKYKFDKSVEKTQSNILEVEDSSNELSEYSTDEVNKKEKRLSWSLGKKNINYKIDIFVESCGDRGISDVYMNFKTRCSPYDKHLYTVARFKDLNDAESTCISHAANWFMDEHPPFAKSHYENFKIWLSECMYYNKYNGALLKIKTNPDCCSILKYCIKYIKENRKNIKYFPLFTVHKVEGELGRVYKKLVHKKKIDYSKVNAFLLMEAVFGYIKIFCGGFIIKRHYKVLAELWKEEDHTNFKVALGVIPLTVDPLRRELFGEFCKFVRIMITNSKYTGWTVDSVHNTILDTLISNGIETRKYDKEMNRQIFRHFVLDSDMKSIPFWFKDRKHTQIQDD